MTVNNHSVLSTTFQNVNDLGRKASTADAMIVIHSRENLQLLTKQFPWPVATVKDMIEFYAPNGQLMVQPQNNKTKFEGPISFYEVYPGTVADQLIALIESGAQFDATAYAGRPEDYSRKEELLRCTLVMDVPDRDWENDTALVFAGTLHFHWFANK